MHPEKKHVILPDQLFGQKGCSIIFKKKEKMKKRK